MKRSCTVRSTKKNNQRVAGKGRWVGSLRYKSEQLVGANKVKVEILDTPFLIRKHESILPTNIRTTAGKKKCHLLSETTFLPYFEIMTVWCFL